MAFIDWKSSFETGIPAIDQQHRRLVEMINEFHEAMKARRGAEKSREILEGLVDYTKTHFRDEENLLRAKGYVALATHMALHKDLLVQVAAFVDKYNTQQQVSSLDLSEFLRNWLTQHILQEDMKYAKALAA
jgi:hemerythrin-like metal-binding protein